jgi:DNA polymerase III sliding clamp (beta) subunit (PCNA family)
MSISISAGALKDAIRKALKAVSVPSEQGVKGMLTLEAADGCMHVHAREEGQSIRVLASNSIELNCPRMQVGVNAKNLEKLMNSFGDDASVVVEQSSAGLVLKVGRSKMVLPQLTELQQLIFGLGDHLPVGEQILSVKASVLSASLHAVEHAAARNDIRAFLCGVTFDFSGGRLRLRASNGIGLLNCDTGIQVNPGHGQIILPINFAEPLAALLSKEAGDAELRLVKKSEGDEVNALVVETSSLRYRSNLVAARFPDMNATRVSEFERPIAVGTKALRSALERLSIVGSSMKLKGVAMQIVKGELRLQLDQNDSEEFVPGAGDDTIVVGADAGSLLSMLDRMTAEEVVFQFPAEHSPRHHFYFGEPDEGSRSTYGMLAQYIVADASEADRPDASKSNNVKPFPMKKQGMPEKAAA